MSLYVSQPTVLYSNPTRRIFGPGVFSQIGSIVSEFKPKTILLIMGSNSFRRSPAYQRLRSALEKYKIIESAPVSQNPHQAFIQDEIERLHLISFDLVLAIGGGSVLDVSKILASITRQKDRRIEKYMTAGILFNPAPVPVIAVPTTSGTGSEVTPYASIETMDKKKISLSHELFYPAVALIDPDLTLSMPEYVTASTGFDALSQAIESFWAVAATPSSRIHALKAAELIFLSLATAVQDPLNRKARESMAYASCEAGLAIAETKTTAVHSVSYPITAHFGVAHGHACALTLAPFVEFNKGSFAEENKLLKACKTPTSSDLAKKISELMGQSHLESSLSKLGIDASGQELIIRDGFRPDRVLNNPRKLAAEDLRKILSQIA